MSELTVQTRTTPDIDHSELRTRVEEAVASNKRLMTSQLARELGVPEAEIIRVLPPEQVTELNPESWEDIIRSFESLDGAHVIVNSNAVTQECFGQFGHFSHWGDYFNVQTKSIDMHIRYKELASIFAVRKASHMDGRDTLSVQFYDRHGTSAFKVFLTFGGKEVPVEKDQFFQELVRRFRKEGA